MKYRDIIYVSTGNTTTTKTVYLIYTARPNRQKAVIGPNRLQTVWFVKQLLIEN